MFYNIHFEILQSSVYKLSTINKHFKDNHFTYETIFSCIK